MRASQFPIRGHDYCLRGIEMTKVKKYTDTEKKDEVENGNCHL